MFRMVGGFPVSFSVHFLFNSVRGKFESQFFVFVLISFEREMNFPSAESAWFQYRPAD
jgi:hypothetical protein